MLPADHQELLRHAALEALAFRHPVALPVAGIKRRVEHSVDFRFETADLVSALEVLRGLRYTAKEHDPLGSSDWYRATSEGVLFIERGSQP
jgi:hypothetical protein